MISFRSQYGRSRTAISISLALFLLAGAGPAFHSQPASAASFECEKPDLAADEKAICDNRMLNDADVRMVTTFDLLSGLLAMGARGAMQDDQTAWLKRRQACGGDVACIQSAYDERMRQLDEAYKNLNRPL
jgi:uncharacterized protein